MKITDLEINNILSIEHVRLEFKDSGLVLLDGWNYDDDSANGAGKTAIFNALSFGVYNEFPRKISVSEILRRGTKTGSVSVGIDTGSEHIRVIRYRPNRVEFFINGESNDSMTQEEFESKIGLSYRQFLISMYSAQTEGEKLISLNDSGKKDFFLQLMNLDRFSHYKKYIDGQIKSMREDYHKIDKLIAECRSKIAVYQESVVDTEDVKRQIKLLDVAPLIRELKEVEGVTKPDLSQLRELERQTSNRIKELDKQDAEEQALRKEHASLVRKLTIAKQQQSNFTDDVKCPHCMKSFGISETGESVTAEIVAERMRKHLDAMQLEIDDLVKQINSLPNTDIERRELNTILVAVSKKKAKEEDDYDKARDRTSELKSKIAIRKSKIEQLSDALDQQQDIALKIEELHNVLVRAESKIKAINANIEKYEIISSSIAPTGAPAYIMDSVIDVFNDKIAEYVGMLWANASYALQSFKENKSGDVKAKFSERLIIGGKSVSIGSLSGGEFKCLSLAVDFAVMDVIEDMFGIAINPIVMDEPFEGLDSSNRERAVDMFSKVALKRQIWVIDHASEAKAMFTDVVKVVKKAGVSSLQVI